MAGREDSVQSPDPPRRAVRTSPVTKKFDSPEQALAYLSDVTRLSGEALAANVLATTVVSCLGVDDAIAEQARALLARVKLEGGYTRENARLMAVAEARLEALLDELSARHLTH